MALTAYEDSHCPGCGQPKEIAYNPDQEGWYEAREVTCAGCAAQHEHDKAQKTPTPGRKLYVVNTRPKDRELRPWRFSSGADNQPADE